MVGNVAYSQPGLEVGAPILGGVPVAQGSVLLYDAGFRLSVPVGRWRPAVQPLHPGRGRRDAAGLRGGPVSARSTNLAYNVGAGVNVDLGPRLGLQLMAKDYIGKFDAKEATSSMWIPGRRTTGP